MEDFWIYLGVYFFLAVIVLGAVSLVFIAPIIYYFPGRTSPESWSRFFGGRFRIAVVCVLFFVLVLIVVFLGLVLAGFSPGSGSRPPYDGEKETCNQRLKNQLVFQHAVSTAGQINEVIRQVQATRDNCVSAVWDPLVVDPVVGDRTFPDPGCVAEEIEPEFPPEYDFFPEISAVSSRDSEGNLFVYWDPTEMTRSPGDGAVCWIYVVRVNHWYAAY